jgi:hypothetical protein
MEPPPSDDGDASSHSGDSSNSAHPSQEVPTQQTDLTEHYEQASGTVTPQFCKQRGYNTVPLPANIEKHSTMRKNDKKYSNHTDQARADWINMVNCALDAATPGATMNGLIVIGEGSRDMIKNLLPFEVKRILQFFMLTVTQDLARAISVIDKNLSHHDVLQEAIHLCTRGTTRPTTNNMSDLHQRFQNVRHRENTDPEGTFTSLWDIIGQLHALGEHLSPFMILARLINIFDYHEGYKTVIAAFKASEDATNVEKLKQQIRERWSVVSRGKKTTFAGGAVGGGSSNPGGGRGDKKDKRDKKGKKDLKDEPVKPEVKHCDHCNRKHTGGEDNCWKKHPELMPAHIRENIQRKQKGNAKKANGATAHGAIQCRQPQHEPSAASGSRIKCHYCRSTHHDTEHCTVDPDSEHFLYCRNCHKGGHTEDTCSHESA